MSDSRVKSTMTARALAERALDAARAAAGRLTPRDTGMVCFRSEGRVGIVAGLGHGLALAGRLPDGFCPVVIVPERKPVAVEAGEQDGIEVIRGALSRLRGHLGSFDVEFDTPGGSEPLAKVTAGRHRAFDLVLDLSAVPLIDSAIVPIGYFAPAGSAEALERALIDLSDLRGEFEKPQYYSYDAAICAHGRSGIGACTRCLDACPTGAIASLVERVQIDPNLCQGVGICATACPSGAIRYAYPCAGDLLERLRAMLSAYEGVTNDRPRLLIHDAAAGLSGVGRLLDSHPEGVLPVEVEDPASVGMEAWLSALAYGAASVAVLPGNATPPRVLMELRAQVHYAQALLEGMGYPGSLVRLLVTTGEEPELGNLLEEAARSAIPRAGFAGLDDKRQALRMAVDHLHGAAPAPRPMISLPTGAPFGEVTVDDHRCTLCMACVSQCPAKALEAGGDVPELLFVEDNCVQCGICARSCPENAIAPSPRYLYDGLRRRSRRVLKADSPFHCIRCGKPFGTASMIHKMKTLLGSHPRFQGAAAQRLQMCEDCRVVALFEDEMTAGPGS